MYGILASFIRGAVAIGWWLRDRSSPKFIEFASEDDAQHARGFLRKLRKNS
jgi:hypothetical protein